MITLYICVTSIFLAVKNCFGQWYSKRVSNDAVEEFLLTPGLVTGVPILATIYGDVVMRSLRFGQWYHANNISMFDLFLDQNWKQFNLSNYPSRIPRA